MTLSAPNQVNRHNHLMFTDLAVCLVAALGASGTAFASTLVLLGTVLAAAMPLHLHSRGGQKATLGCEQLLSWPAHRRKISNLAMSLGAAPAFLGTALALLVGLSTHVGLGLFVCVLAASTQRIVGCPPPILQRQEKCNENTGMHLASSVQVRGERVLDFNFFSSSTRPSSRQGCGNLNRIMCGPERVSVLKCWDQTSPADG